MTLEESLRKRMKEGVRHLLAPGDFREGGGYELVRYVDGSKVRSVARWTLRLDRGAFGQGILTLRINDGMARMESRLVSPGKKEVDEAWIEQCAAFMASEIRGLLSEAVRLLSELELDPEDMAAEMASAAVAVPVHSS